MVRTEDPLTMHLYTGWVGTLMASLALPWVWTEISLQSWALMMLMGLSAAVGHFMLILAYERTPVATMAPYLYAQIAFAVIGGWLVFDQLPDAWSWIGMALIAVSGICGAWLTARENSTAATMPET